MPEEPVPNIFEDLVPLQITADEGEADDNLAQCSECNCDFAEDELANGRCETCNENYSTCGRCDDAVHNSNTVTVRTNNSRRGGEETWCDDCSSHSWDCNDCNNVFSDNVDHRTDPDDNRVCERCYDEHYGYCDSCERTIPAVVFGADGMCQECYDNHERDEDNEGDNHERDEDNEGDSQGGRIRDYGYKPAPIFHGKGRQYGVELEVNCNLNTAEDTIHLLGGGDHIYLKEDSSIDSGGYEIVSHPHDVAEHRKLWKPFFANVPKGMTGYKTGECGMHIHISRKGLTDMHIQKMVVFLTSEGNKDFITAVAQRESCTYNNRAPKKLSDTYHGKHDALNTASGVTIEVRIFRSTVREDRFFKNLEFVDAMVQWTSFLSYRNLGYAGFVAWVRDRRKEFPNLFAYLVERGYTTLPLKDIVKETFAKCA